MKNNYTINKYNNLSKIRTLNNCEHTNYYTFCIFYCGILIKKNEQIFLQIDAYEIERSFLLYLNPHVIYFPFILSIHKISSTRYYLLLTNL